MCHQPWDSRWGPGPREGSRERSIAAEEPPLPLRFSPSKAFFLEYSNDFCHAEGDGEAEIPSGDEPAADNEGTKSPAWAPRAWPGWVRHGTAVLPAGCPVPSPRPRWAQPPLRNPELVPTLCCVPRGAPGSLPPLIPRQLPKSLRRSRGCCHPGTAAATPAPGTPRCAAQPGCLSLPRVPDTLLTVRGAGTDSRLAPRHPPMGAGVGCGAATTGWSWRDLVVHTASLGWADGYIDSTR